MNPELAQIVTVGYYNDLFNKYSVLLFFACLFVCLFGFFFVRSYVSRFLLITEIRPISVNNHSTKLLL